MEEPINQNDVQDRPVNLCYIEYTFYVTEEWLKKHYVPHATELSLQYNGAIDCQSLRGKSEFKRLASKVFEVIPDEFEMFDVCIIPHKNKDFEDLYNVVINGATATRTIDEHKNAAPFATEKLPDCEWTNDKESRSCTGETPESVAIVMARTKGTGVRCIKCAGQPFPVSKNVYLNDPNTYLS